MKQKLKDLSNSLEGELYTDRKTRILYSTDASAYRELPLAVAIPKSVDDLKMLIHFAANAGTSLIPRTAGTSLAGQVVGSGIVVDISKYLNRILEINTAEGWVRVEPGVVRDELNKVLKPFGFFFAPETSTANRAMIGGMIGNNSCGSNSIVYQSTREHTFEIKALLTDASIAEFKEISFDAFNQKCEGDSLEAAIYKNIRGILGEYANQQSIRKEFPKKTILRRNTGYAIDVLLESDPFTAGAAPFNFCKLLAGSEGTLALMTECKLKIEPLPAQEKGLLCIHFNSIDEALRANLIALQFKPGISELIDKYILDCTKDHIAHVKNRFFLLGDPQAVLVVEYSGNTKADVLTTAKKVETAMRNEGLGYHFPLLFGEDMNRIWALRKAGLGLLSNLPGDEKAVAVIEDTAVDVEDLPSFVKDFNELLKKYGLFSVHYAHAGSGELHLRPILNLKTADGQRLFHIMAAEIATLVKHYKGSLSGEHGDGRLRGEFIEQMIGRQNFELLRSIKAAWDPLNIFNPGKIIDTPRMNTMLRYEVGQSVPSIPTIFRYAGQNVLQHVEQCNGSGDCRKTHLMGGTMCPSYMATRNESDTTRARANVLREMLTHSHKINRFDHKEIKEVMDLCLSCKACKSECPSKVDMAKLKAEFLQAYYDANGIPLRSRIIGSFYFLSKIGSFFPSAYNWFVQHPAASGLMKKICGFAPKRSIPSLHQTTLRSWFVNRPQNEIVKDRSLGSVYFFCDEFTDFNDTEIGIKAILLLERLGYEVIMPVHRESGRSLLSKGLLRKAKTIAEENVDIFAALVDDSRPLVGIEPSAMICFRDEYPDLVGEKYLPAARVLAEQTMLIDEFIAKEFEKGKIDSTLFTSEKREIKLHGHCQQKALAGLHATETMLSIPSNYTVEVIASGCCGMAGSFGYEREHYDISMQIGEMVLFPAVRQLKNNMLLAAPGTSCRHQIKDGTGTSALHPVEILYDALTSPLS